VLVKEAKTVNSLRVYKGKTVYKYRSPGDNDSPDINAGNFPFWSISSDWKRGVITQKKVYDEAGVWLIDDQNSYTLKPSQNYSKYTSIKTGKFIHNIEASPNGYDQNVFTFSKYQSITGFQFNEQSINNEQFKVNNNLSNIQNISQFVYGNDNHLQLTETTTTNSKGENIITQFKFPNDINSGDLQTTASLLGSRKAELLQTETFLNSASIGKNQSFFGVFGGKTLPSSQKTFIGGSSIPSTETLQLSYDSYGNLTSFKEVGGAIHSFLWGCNGQYPVVYIANGTPPDPSALLTTFDANTIEATANNLRSSLPNAKISCYSFKPMVGMLSSTSPNVIKTSFEFDGLQRLHKIKNHSNYLTDLYSYIYATVLTGCTSPSPPNISVGTTSLCNLTLNATGCSGTVNWSNGAVGNSISVPSKTTLTYTATCLVSSCTSGVSNSLVIPPLPSGWASGDIGSAEGCTQNISGSLALLGSGAVGGSDDTFHWVYKSMSGDFTMIAKIANLPEVGGMRSGIMIRSNTGSNTQFYTLIQDGNANVGELKRDTNGGNGELYSFAGSAVNQTWIKIVKTGTTIKGYHSTDSNPEVNNQWDANFQLTGNNPTTLDFGTNYLIGFISSGSANQTTFSNITLNGNAF